MSETNIHHPNISPLAPSGTERIIGGMAFNSSASVLPGVSYELSETIQTAKAGIVRAAGTLFSDKPDRVSVFQKRLDEVPITVLEDTSSDSRLSRQAAAYYDGEKIVLGPEQNPHVITHELIHATSSPEDRANIPKWFIEAVTEDLAAAIDGTTDPKELTYDGERAMLKLLLAGRNRRADLQTAAQRAVLGNEDDSTHFKEMLDQAWDVRDALGKATRIVNRATEEEAGKPVNRLPGAKNPWTFSRDVALLELSAYYAQYGPFALEDDMKNRMFKGQQ